MVYIPDYIFQVLQTVYRLFILLPLRGDTDFNDKKDFHEFGFFGGLDFQWTQSLKKLVYIEIYIGVNEIVLISENRIIENQKLS